MAKLTLKEKESLRKQTRRQEHRYRDLKWLILIVLGVWLFQSPAVYGLIVSTSRSHFRFYGWFLLLVSVLGFAVTVLLLALDCRRASIIVSWSAAALIMLVCALIYIGYNRALNTSNLHVPQIILSYGLCLAVPIADTIAVRRRI